MIRKHRLPLAKLSNLLIATSVVMCPVPSAQAILLPMAPPTAIATPLPAPNTTPIEHNDASEVFTSVLITLAEAAQAEGNTANAMHFYEQVLRLRSIIGKPTINAAIASGRLAFIYEDMHKLAKAEMLVKQALKDIDSLFGSASEAAGIALNNWALIKEKLGNKPQAEALYKRSLNALQSDRGSSADVIAIVEANLANFYCKANRLREAEHQYKSALENLRKISGEKDPEIQAIKSRLTRIHYCLQQKYHEDKKRSTLHYPT